MVGLRRGNPRTPAGSGRYPDRAGCPRELGFLLKLTKISGGKHLHIRVENPDHRESGCRSMSLNGKELPDNYIPEGLLKEENEILLTL